MKKRLAALLLALVLLLCAGCSAGGNHTETTAPAGTEAPAATEDPNMGEWA